MRSLIIAVCIIALAATIGTIIVGSRMFEGLVVERPYETGLQWDEMQKRAASLGWKITIETGSFRRGTNELRLKVTDRHGSPLDGLAVAVTLSRPSTRDYDRTYRMTPESRDCYRASIVIPLGGQWDLRTEITGTGGPFFSVERIRASE